MIRLQVATLSDGANVREGLASILGAGISMLRRPEFPAPIAAMLVVIFEMSDELPGTSHEIKVSVRNRNSQKLILEADATLGPARNAELLPGGVIATATAPLLVPLHGAAVDEPGQYEAAVEADGELIGGARFDVVLDRSIDFRPVFEQRNVSTPRAEPDSAEGDV